MTRAIGPMEARLIFETVALPALRMEHAITKRVLAAVPVDRLDYRPQAGARTLAELAQHIITVEFRFLRGATSGAFLIESPPPISAENWVGLLESYSRDFPRALDASCALTGDQLLLMLDYRGFIQMPTLGFVQFTLNHTIHHRGQLSVYLRMLQLPVPAIYG